MAKLYKNATETDPVMGYTPLDFGWELCESQMQVKFYEGEQVPPT